MFIWVGAHQNLGIAHKKAGFSVTANISAKTLWRNAKNNVSKLDKNK